MRLIFILPILITAITITSCSETKTEPRPSSYYQAAPVQANHLKPLTLETGKKKLSNKDFQSILRHRVKLPKKNRIAVLNITGDHQWRNYSPQLSRLTDKVNNRLYEILQKSQRVYDASPMSALIRPNTNSMAKLRIAAANYQADMLLIHRTHCSSFQKYKIFKADKNKSFCTVEAVLLDIRTGITPFSTKSTNIYEARENKQDDNFLETIKKAELKAIEKSLVEVGNNVVEYLSRRG